MKFCEHTFTTYKNNDILKCCNCKKTCKEICAICGKNAMYYDELTDLFKCFECRHKLIVNNE